MRKNYLNKNALNNEEFHSLMKIVEKEHKKMPSRMLFKIQKLMIENFLNLAKSICRRIKLFNACKLFPSIFNKYYIFYQYFQNEMDPLSPNQCDFFKSFCKFAISVSN